MVVVAVAILRCVISPDGRRKRKETSSPSCFKCSSVSTMFTIVEAKVVLPVVEKTMRGVFTLQGCYCCIEGSREQEEEEEEIEFELLENCE
jgi:hypothetical protein